MSVYRQFAKDTFIYGLASVLPRAVNVLLVSLHTYVLLPDAYAVNTKFYVLIAFFNALFTYGMETAFFRFYTLFDKDPKVLRTAFTSLLVSSILFAGLLFVFREPLLEILEVREEIYLVFVSILLLDTWMVIPYAYLRVTHRSVKFAYYRIFHVAVYAFFNVFFLIWLPRIWAQGTTVFDWYMSQPKVYYIFLANLIASFLTFLLFVPMLMRFKLGWEAGLWKKMLSYGLPVMWAGIFYIINENFDKLALDYYLGGEVMGAYSAVYKIGVFMILFITAFRLGAEPFYFNQSKEKEAPVQYAHIMTAFVVLGSLIMLSVMMFLPWIVWVFIRNQAYLKALDIVPVILLAYLFLGIYFNLSVWYKLTDRTRYGMFFSFIGATITVLLNVWLIPKIGFMASAWATLAAYLVMTVLSFWTGKKYYHIPYQSLKVAFIVLTSAVLSFVMYEFFYHQWIYKSLLFTLYLIFIYRLEQKTFQALFVWKRKK